MVSHDAKECSVWLSSKGSLSLDQQEYGSWLQADPFSVGKKSFMFVPGSGGAFGGVDNHVRSGSGSIKRSQEAETLQEVQTTATVVSTVVGGAHGPRGSSTEHSMLTQPKAKDGDSVKEPDILHEKGKGDGLVGKQEGKLTEVEVFASNCPISHAKVVESMQWEKGVGFFKKDKKAGGLETWSSWA